jgi:hypothetical protein
MVIAQKIAKPRPANVHGIWDRAEKKLRLSDFRYSEAGR